MINKDTLFVNEYMIQKFVFLKEIKFIVNIYIYIIFNDDVKGMDDLRLLWQ